jgi:hypothetical protein
MRINFLLFKRVGNDNFYHVCIFFDICSVAGPGGKLKAKFNRGSRGFSIENEGNNLPGANDNKQDVIIITIN